MRIIKAPEFNICECEICGTVFQPEAKSDNFRYEYHQFNPKDEKYEILTRCPVCSRLVKVTVKKGGEG